MLWLQKVFTLTIVKYVSVFIFVYLQIQDMKDWNHILDLKHILDKRDAMGGGGS